MRTTIISLAILISSSCLAQEQVKHIGAFVEPYYRAAESATGTPQVAVARAFDDRLKLKDPSKIKEVEAEIRANPALITPMTMMVLSIRLYDVGFRDDAVFWHYVAKDRMFTINRVVSDGISGAMLATRDFAATAGQVINGYAFCNLEAQKSQRKRAFEWVRDNPYQAIFLPQLSSPFSDREAALKDAIGALENNVRKEADFVSESSNVERLKRVRSENGTHAKYCW
jgi:hypothetical protein